jgi:hypothetical protein
MRATGTLRRHLTRRAAAAAASVVLAACTATASTGKPAAAQGGGVISLTRISTLRSVFNRDGGHPRLMLIFSPT